MWPAGEGLKKASGVIIVFVVICGVLIGVMDWLLQLIFVTVVSKLF